MLDLIAFMRANSPTFAAAYEIRANENRGISLNPVSGTNGGTVSGIAIVFGTHTGVRPDGTAVYPAYTLAHEFGHENQRASNANPAWNLPNTAFGENEDGSLMPARKILQNIMPTNSQNGFRLRFSRIPVSISAGKKITGTTAQRWSGAACVRLNKLSLCTLKNRSWSRCWCFSSVP